MIKMYISLKIFVQKFGKLFFKLRSFNFRSKKNVRCSSSKNQASRKRSL